MAFWCAYDDVFVLIGAHTLGHVHCPNIQDRFDYANFRSPEPIDHTLKKQLYECCVNNKPSGCEGDFPNKDILETPEVSHSNPLSKGSTCQCAPCALPAS